MGARLGTIAMAATCLMACAPESPTAIVVGSMIPDESCVVSSESTFLFKGVYDATTARNGGCGASYNMRLLVNSYLIARGSPVGNPPPVRAEPNVLRINEASVTLMEANGDRINFGDPRQFPNPFGVTTFAIIPPAEFEDPGSGIALVEAIPSFYATTPRFQDIANANSTVLAEIKLFGETTGGVEIELAEFQFPIQTCLGCLTLCRSDIEETALEDLLDGQCLDNAAADGRPCVLNVCP